MRIRSASEQLVIGNFAVSTLSRVFKGSSSSGRPGGFGPIGRRRVRLPIRGLAGPIAPPAVPRGVEGVRIPLPLCLFHHMRVATFLSEPSYEAGPVPTKERDGYHTSMLLEIE